MGELLGKESVKQKDVGMQVSEGQSRLPDCVGVAATSPARQHCQAQLPVGKELL